MKYTKTEAGKQAFKNRSPQLSAKQRMAFILFDGVKTLEQVLAATAGLTQAEVAQMVEQGLLEPTQQSTSSSSQAGEVSAESASVGSGLTPQERYAQAYPLATKLTASLGLRGFTLNLAVEAASGYDDLLALLPKIQNAVGVEAAAKLERVLKA